MVKVDTELSLIVTVIYVSIGLSSYLLIISKMGDETDPHLLNILGLIVSIGGTLLIALPEWYGIRLKKAGWKNTPLLRIWWIKLGTLTILIGFSLQIFSSTIQYWA